MVRKRPKWHERFIHKEIVKMLPDVLPSGSIVHSSDVADRDPRRIVHKKSMGAISGWPDITVLLPAGRTCFIEMKTRLGQLTDSQKELHGRMLGVGHEVIVAKTAEDLREGLAKMGLDSEVHSSGWERIMNESTEMGWRRREKCVEAG